MKIWLTVLIIVILAVAAYFVYSNRDSWVPVSGAESIINKLETQNQSDEITSIESDLQNTEFQGLDSELSNIESELQNAGL